MTPLSAFLLGLLIGIGLCCGFFFLKKKDKQSAQSDMKTLFASLSHESLSKNTETFLQIAKENFAQQSDLNAKDLQSKKEGISEVLDSMKKELNRVQDGMQALEKDRAKKFGELSQYLLQSTQETTKLRETTGQLKEALASSKVRGQWGERMAEDVLRLSGLVEGINYTKQKALPSGNGIPDFTFFLPNQLKVNMDVKFPLTNYMNYLDSNTDIEKDQFKQLFFRDVRLRIKEVHDKGYINPSENTVDYAILFIPNEQVYSFINEQNRSLIDDALQKKVIFCSPLSLYALLAIIRQAIDTFAMEKTTSEILALIGNFHKQWAKFNENLDKMGRRINDAQTEYQTLMSTRKTALERPLQKIEALRQDQKIKLFEETL